MFRKLILVSALALLSGCGDPLAGLDRLSDVDLADTSATAQVLPSDDEIAREGFFGTDAARGREIPTKVGPEDRSSGGFFGRPKAGAALRDGPDAQEVIFGTVLPYGEVARVCGAKGKKLGQKVEKASARGFALFDSAPGTVGARTYYITGFKDGCPRQLTAATAILSAPSTYEQYRFGPAGQNLPRAATDTAYDSIKGRVCGAGKRKPCGARIGRMDKITFFVTSYEFLGANARWSEMLIHDGAVMATAVKRSG